MFNLFDFTYTQDGVTKQKPQWQVDMETKDRAPDLSNTTLGKIVQGTNEFFKSNPAILSKGPKEIFGGISQGLQNTATSIKNAGYGDAEGMAEQQKSFISDMLAKGYDKETIFKAMDQLKAQGKFQGSITENPITGTLSSIAAAPLQALGTIAKGGESAARAGELAQEGDTSGATATFGRGLTEGALGGLGFATGFTPGGAAVNTAFSSETVSQPLEKYVSAPIRKGVAMGQEALGYNPESEGSKALQETAGMVGPLAVLGAGQKYIAPRVVPAVQKTFNYAKNLGKINPKVEKGVTNKGIEEIYEAVNPTTRENKAQLRKRVDDLLPYIDEKSLFNNELTKVKERVDIDKNSSFDSMRAYEDTVGVKGKAETTPIIKSIQDKFIEKTSEGVVIDEATSKIANELISKLKEFGPVLKDGDIIKVRRSWDKIIEKNKGFMQSAESNTKGEIFNEANKYFRDEIRKSNPEYAKYLEKAHKTIALSDILEATIQRRTGQSQGGYLRRTGENVARVAGAGLGGVIGTALGSPAIGAGVGYAATEGLLSGVSKLSGSSAKLARGKRLLLKQGKNDNNTNASTNTSVRSVQSNKPLVTKGPRLNLAEEQAKAKLTQKTNEPIIKKSTTPEVQGTSGKIPEGSFKNAFGEIVKKPNSKKAGILNIGQIGKDLGIIKKSDPLIEEAKKYKSADEFIKAQGEPVYHGTYATKTNDIQKVKEIIEKIYQKNGGKYEQNDINIIGNDAKYILENKNKIKVNDEELIKSLQDELSTKIKKPSIDFAGKSSKDVNDNILGIYVTPDMDFAKRFTYDVDVNPYNGKRTTISPRPGYVIDMYYKGNTLDLTKKSSNYIDVIAEVTGKNKEYISGNLKTKEGTKVIQKLLSSKRDVLKEKGFNAVKNYAWDDTAKKYKEELAILDDNSIRTKDELKQIYEQANKTKVVPKVVESKAGTMDIGKAPDALVQEAKKYKSADEFVKAKTDFIHETNAGDIKEFNMNKIGSGEGESWLGRGIYMQKKGSFKIEKYGNNEIQVGLTPNAKIFEIKDTPDGKWRDNFVEWFTKKEPRYEPNLEEWRNKKNILPRDILNNKGKGDKVIDDLLADGYDGILQDGELVIFNPSVLKTQSQLKDIYNQANKSSILKPKAISESVGIGKVPEGPQVLSSKGGVDYKIDDISKPKQLSAFKDGKIVGKLYLSSDTIKGEKYLHIDGIEVSKSERGQGIGTEILKNAIESLGKKSEYKGIIARYDTIANKKEIPYIFNKLGFKDKGGGAGLGIDFNKK